MCFNCGTHPSVSYFHEADLNIFIKLVAYFVITEIYCMIVVERIFLLMLPLHILCVCVLGI